MLEKIISYAVACLFFGGIFCIMFFNLTPFSPKPVKVEESKTYFDVDDKPIMYKLSVVGEIKYSQWINPRKRKRLEDSLKVANVRIMDDYFQTNYMEKVSDDTIIQSFDFTKYFNTPFPYDSINFQLLLVKRVSLMGKPLSP